MILSEKEKKKAAEIVKGIHGCTNCGKHSKVHCVFTMHGKEILHFPVCSPECLDELMDLYVETISGIKPY